MEFSKADHQFELVRKLYENNITSNTNFNLRMDAMEKIIKGGDIVFQH